MTDVSNFIEGAFAAPNGERTYRAVNPSRISDLIADYRLSSPGQRHGTWPRLVDLHHEPRGRARLVSRAEAGVTSVNLPTAGVELQAPFGGTKASGLGVKEQGRPVLDFYSEWRSVYMKVA